MEDFWGPPCIRPTLGGGVLHPLGLYREWVPPNGQYPDFPFLMNVAQMKIVLGPHSKAWL